MINALKLALQRLPLKGRCGVAVSGGGDSMALALMLKECLGEVVALHFDHGLRAGSGEEAQWVEKSLKDHSIPTVVGRWSAPAAGNNVQAQAREARYRFFKQACDDIGLQAVFVAHTADDVAETLLMRLGRGSGLHGLAVLPEVSHIYGVQVFRPLLKMRRQDLREYLQRCTQNWLEDPSNQNPKFWRPRVRAAMQALAQAGVEVDSMMASVSALHEASAALDAVTASLWQQIACYEAGEVALNWSVLQQQPMEIQIRVVQKALRHFSPEDEQLPRRKQIKDALEALGHDPRRRSLGKCLCHRQEKNLIFTAVL